MQANTKKDIIHPKTIYGKIKISVPVVPVTGVKPDMSFLEKDFQRFVDENIEYIKKYFKEFYSENA